MPPAHLERAAYLRGRGWVARCPPSADKGDEQPTRRFQWSEGGPSRCSVGALPVRGGRCTVRQIRQTVRQTDRRTSRGTHGRERRPAEVLVLWQEPEAGQEAHRRSGCL